MHRRVLQRIGQLFRAANHACTPGPNLIAPIQYGCSSAYLTDERNRNFDSPSSDHQSYTLDELGRSVDKVVVAGDKLANVRRVYWCYPPPPEPVEVVAGRVGVWCSTNPIAAGLARCSAGSARGLDAGLDRAGPASSGRRRSAPGSGRDHQRPRRDRRRQLLNGTGFGSQGGSKPGRTDRYWRGSWRCRAGYLRCQRGDACHGDKRAQDGNTKDDDHHCQSTRGDGSDSTVHLSRRPRGCQTWSWPARCGKRWPWWRTHAPSPNRP